MTTVYLSLVKPDAPRERVYGEGEDALRVPVPDSARDCVQALCTACGREHDALYVITRTTRDSGLYWPYVNINNRRVLLDASLPTVVTRLPNDAVAVDAATSARLWHEDNESHVFGGPNVAAALRAAVAAHNAG